MNMTIDDARFVWNILQSIIAGGQAWKAARMDPADVMNLFENYESMGLENMVDGKVCAWENREVIDSIFQNPGDLNPGQLKLLRRWQKQAVFGWYIMLEIEDGDAIFIGPDDGETFWRVRPITTPWEEMIDHSPLPVMVQGALLPFEKSIIVDGMVRVDREVHNPDRVQEAYALLRQAKENGTIRTGFPPLDRPGISQKRRRSGGRGRK